MTIEGRHLHEKAHDGKSESIAGVRTARGLWLRSLKYGLVGQADVVEFQADATVVPVEHKRDKPKKDGIDRVQLCAQAICLEETLEVVIGTGELFCGQRKRRVEVVFDEETANVNAREDFASAREDRQSGDTTSCSLAKVQKLLLVELGLPDSLRFKQGAAAWNEGQFAAVKSHGRPLQWASLCLSA